MKEFTPNTTGLMIFLFFLVLVWAIIREGLVLFFGDGDLIRFVGVFLGLIVINPMYKSFVKFVYFCYHD